MTEYMTQTPNYRSKEQSMAYVLAELRNGAMLKDILDKNGERDWQHRNDELVRLSHFPCLTYDNKFVDDVDAEVVGELIKEGKLNVYFETDPLNESYVIRHFRLAGEQQS